jgi:hypothetical protein
VATRWVQAPSVPAASGTLLTVPLPAVGEAPFPAMTCPPTAQSPLLFMHVPKNAGSTVREALQCVAEGHSASRCGVGRSRVDPLRCSALQRASDCSAMAAEDCCACPACKGARNVLYFPADVLSLATCPLRSLCGVA